MLRGRRGRLGGIYGGATIAFEQNYNSNKASGTTTIPQ